MMEFEVKTSTSLLIAAGAVVAVVGVGSTVYADSGWRGQGHGPCREDSRNWHDSDMRGPGPRGPMQGSPMQGAMRGPMGGPGFMAAHGPMGGMMGPMVVKRVFQLADTDKDGKLTQEEIDAARTARFEAHDTNGDGKLTLDEFQGLFAEVTEPATVRVFQFLDPDGDAAITKDEFDRPSDRIVQKFDRNGDGVLSPADRGYGPRPGPKAGPGPKSDDN
jgi:hypothetical protein